METPPLPPLVARGGGGVLSQRVGSSNICPKHATPTGVPVVGECKAEYVLYIASQQLCFLCFATSGTQQHCAITMLEGRCDVFGIYYYCYDDQVHFNTNHILV